MRFSASVVRRQIPQAEETFLDHVGLFVEDLDAAGAALERLGFLVSQANVQRSRGADGRLSAIGSSNRNVVLPFGFLELLSPSSPSKLSAQMEIAIERYEGLHLVAFSQADLKQTERRLLADDWRMERLVELRREGPTVAWDVLRCEPSQMPEGRIQFVLCRTPETVWTPAATAHPNGIDGLSSVLLAVDDPVEAAERFARYIGMSSPPHQVDRVTTLELDRGRLCFVDPDVVRSVGMIPIGVPQIVGVGLSTEKPDLARAWFGSGETATARAPGCLVVDLDSPLNAVLVISPPDADPWPMLLDCSA